MECRCTQYPQCPYCHQEHGNGKGEDLDDFKVGTKLECSSCGKEFIITKADVYKVGVFDTETL